VTRRDVTRREVTKKANKAKDDDGNDRKGGAGDPLITWRGGLDDPSK